jgi:UDP-N-acetylmuramoyl-L-alanyl-D-glutamate--2,6-diaminopimelate ligase
MALCGFCISGMMRFSDLFTALRQPFELIGSPDAPISAPIVESNLEVVPGSVFVARAGLSTDGHRFIPDAIERGAAAIVGERDLRDLPVPYARVENAQEAIGWLAAAYHGFPARRLTVVGVTGTDGKTTTSTLIHAILREFSDGKAGLISTIAADLGGAAVETGLHVTTPGAPQTQALLAEMVANGLRYAVVEMTSHGLAQGRLNGIDLDLAVLTNLTHEHLDYHKTFEAYRAAKGRMFAMLSEAARKPDINKTAIINADDANAEYFAAFPADRVLRYGLSQPADVSASRIVYQPGMTHFFAHHDGLDFVIQSELVGQFNVLNLLAAISAARALDIPIDIIQWGIKRVSAISGRLERVDAGQDYLALVDFAHTPNALKNALEAGRTMVSDGGRVIAVFGCAGLRDVEKRRMMPQIAVRLADIAFFTAEDPRTESLDDILATMADAATQAGGVEGIHFHRVPDRGLALAQACALARSGDVVLALGKGHEQSMAFGTVEYPWDDREALRAAIRGAPLRTLPTA